jgi:arylsulfatase A-like enzyme
MGSRDTRAASEGGLGAITRRELLALMGAGAASLALSRTSWAQDVGGGRRRPNIVLILADDLGYAELGVQGCGDIPTPNIDSIAQNGTRFTSGYVSCPICAPTRAGLMTGRYQQRFGFETNPGPEAYADPKFGLPREQTTLAERLKGLGYATGMFGKWHLGYRPELQPTQRGFDEFLGFLSGANDYLAGGRRSDRILRGTEIVDEPEYLTDAFAREAVSFIDRHAQEPFLLYLPFNAVHAPLQASDPYLQRFPDIADPNRRTYAAMTAALDDAVGRVLSKLRERGLEEDTLIFFLSDNGGPTSQTTSSNLPLRGYKGQTYDGGIRIPFMAQWKGHLPAGKVSDHPVIALDIHPTVIAAVGESADPAWRLDGVNLLPYLSGEATGTPHEVLYWRFHQQRAIRQGEWKLVRGNQSATWELYNLADDIGEQHDLAAREPERVRELTTAWDAWNAELMDPLWVRQDARTQGGGGRGAGGSQLEQRFRQLDRNGDGKLTADELRQPGLFQRLDQNGDGSVTLDEARAALGNR